MTGGMPPRGAGRRTIALAALAGLMALAAGVILIVRDRDGQETARIVLRPGDRVELITGAENAEGQHEPAPAAPGGVDAKWIERTAALPAVEKARAVASELKRRNPGFESHPSYDIQDNKVVGWTIAGGTLPDLSPLLAVTELKALTYDDLDPERGAPVLREMASLETINGRSAATFRLAYPANKPKGGVSADWLESVRVQPAETKVQLVMQKLKELNPNFDGRFRRGGDKGRITWLRFHSDAVADISPLQALEHLEQLECSATWPGKGWLADLSPLKGMPLRELNCGGTYVQDLSPLAGMPLRDLVCSRTRVSSLAPLAGMELTWLAVGETAVSDLAPLKGMALKDLACNSTPVSDLAPLQGMALVHLHCHNTAVSDLSPLRGMPLVQLFCHGTRVSDLSPLAGLPLQNLNFPEITPENLAIVRQIKTLQTINGIPAAEFWQQSDGEPAAAEKE